MISKSLTAFSAVLTGQPVPEDLLSTNYSQCIKKLGNLISKKDEKILFSYELKNCKEVLSNSGTSQVEVKECLLKLLFFHLLGYDVSFAFIHAIHLAQSTNPTIKRAGYLLSTFFLGDGHELSVLLVNTITNDLKSEQHEQIALLASCQLISADFIPSILNAVLKKTSSPRSHVREKTLMCMKVFINKLQQQERPRHKQQQDAPTSITCFLPTLMKALSDKEPTVVLLAVEALRDLYEYHANGNNIHCFEQSRTIATKACIDILGQVSNKESTPLDCHYHGIPHAWFQISLLKTLVCLASNSQECTHLLLPSLKQLLSVDTSVKAGLMIMYQVIKSLSHLTYVTSNDVSSFVGHVRVFLDSKFPNVKLAGLRMLGLMCRKAQSTVLPFQAPILQGLSSNDRQILSATFSLMNEIANPTNKNVVCLKLLGQLDLFMRKSQPASVITSKFAFLDDVALQIGSFDIEANDQVILEKDGDDGDEDEKNNNDDIDEDEALIKSILGHLLAITFRFVLEDPLWSLQTYWKVLSLNGNITSNRNNNSINKCIENCSLELTRRLIYLIQNDVNEALRPQCGLTLTTLALDCLKGHLQGNNAAEKTGYSDASKLGRDDFEKRAGGDAHCRKGKEREEVAAKEGDEEKDVGSHYEDTGKETKNILSMEAQVPNILLPSIEILGTLHNCMPTTPIEPLCDDLITLFKSTKDKKMRRTALYSILMNYPLSLNKERLIDELEMLKGFIEKKDYLMKSMLCEHILMLLHEADLVEAQKENEPLDFTLSFMDDLICQHLEVGGRVYKPSTDCRPPSVLVAMQKENSAPLYADLMDSSKGPTFALESDLFGIDNGNTEDLSNNSEYFNKKDEANNNSTGWTLDGYIE